jgi:hypothetical protein
MSFSFKETELLYAELVVYLNQTRLLLERETYENEALKKEIKQRNFDIEILEKRVLMYKTKLQEHELKKEAEKASRLRRASQ